MRTRLFALVTGATMVALVGCSVLPQSPPPLSPIAGLPASPPVRATPTPGTSPASTPKAVDVADGFSAEEHAAVRIRARTCDEFSVGSGFMLDDHTVVTNRHVVENARQITLTTYDGEVFEGAGSVVADAADLALVTVDDPLEFAATIGTIEPTAGDVLNIVGYPLGGPLNTRSGPFVKTVADSLVAGRNDVDLIKVRVEHGNSGSGVYDAEGNIVGVLYATDASGDSFSVTLASLRAFLADTSLQKPNDTTCE